LAELTGRRWFEVGRLDDIPRRGSRRVKGLDADLPIAVFRTADDQVFALVDRCPHKGGPLSEGIVQGCAVACPLHGWVIHLDTGEAEDPDEGQVPAIAVRVEDGRVWLAPPQSCASRSRKVA
jgi:nitrite reductase (NADH) small subunit